MKTTTEHPPNLAPLAALAFSVSCWIGLYAVYADFARAGLELLSAGGMASSVEGAILIGLNAFGLVLLTGFGVGVATMLVRAVQRERQNDNRISGTHH